MTQMQGSSNDGSSRPLAVVTGASSGIGRELAKVFAEHGYDLVTAAEDAAIDEAAGEVRALGAQVTPVRADLATMRGVEELARRVEALGRPVDALALNAGVGLGGAFIEQPVDRMFNLIDLNVRGTVYLARLLLPAMAARKRGRVLVTSSIAALIPGAFSALYNASKSFLQSWAEAVRDELKDSGVTVTALQPGGTDTEFFHRAGLDDTKVGQSTKDSPAEVAKDGFEAMMKGEDHIVAGSFRNKVQATLSEVLPDVLTSAAHRKMAEPGSASK